MNPLTLYALGGAGLFLILAAVSGGGGRETLDIELGGGAPDKGDDLPQSTGGFREVREIAQRYVDFAGAPDWFPEMALIQAASESGGNPYVGLGTVSTFPQTYRGVDLKPNTSASTSLQAAETRAARTVYERNIEKYSQSPAPVADWTFGSGGLFGLLPGSGLAFARREPGLSALRSGELQPLDIFDPVRAVAMYANYVKSVMAHSGFKNLPPEHRNAYAIKRGGAALSLIKDWQEENERSQKIREKMPRRVSASGADPSFPDEPLSYSDWNAWPGAWEAIQRVEG